MTGSFTNYLEEKLLKDLFGISTFSPPSTFYIGVCTGGVAEDGTITGEPSGKGMHGLCGKWRHKLGLFAGLWGERRSRTIQQ
jgi:hypothetical protein